MPGKYRRAVFAPSVRARAPLYLGTSTMSTSVSSVAQNDSQKFIAVVGGPPSLVSSACADGSIF